jgi:transposase-like protein
MRESATGIQGASEWRPPAARRWSERDAQAMARALAASGETPAEFAKRHGLNEERIRRWVRHLAEHDPKRAAPAFAPVRLVEREPEQRGGVEIVVGKRVVRVGVGFCPEVLRQVVEALEATC